MIVRVRLRVCGIGVPVAVVAGVGVGVGGGGVGGVAEQCADLPGVQPDFVGDGGVGPPSCLSSASAWPAATVASSRASSAEKTFAKLFCLVLSLRWFSSVARRARCRADRFRETFLVVDIAGASSLQGVGRVGLITVVVCRT